MHIGVMKLRNLNEIIDAAVVNTLRRLKNEEIEKKIIRKTGNKKALHQKSKNR